MAQNPSQNPSQNPAHQVAALQFLEELRSICKKSGEYHDAKIDQQAQSMPRLNLMMKDGQVAPIAVYVDVSDGGLSYEYPDSFDEKQSERIRQYSLQAFQKTQEAKLQDGTQWIFYDKVVPMSLSQATVEL